MADPKLPLSQMPKHNLFGIDEQDYESARVAVLPVPYDATTTYKSGAREGPDAIINASRNIELYSYELARDISDIGIFTLPAMSPDVSSPEGMIDKIRKEVGIILDDRKLPLLLGGEHTITLGALRAFKDKGRDISVICFDAHSDSRKELLGAKYMHGTVATRVRELYPATFQVGLRSMDSAFARKADRQKALSQKDIQRIGMREAIESILEETGENIYLSIDLDVLDPSEMPSIGTPEPDGLKFRELMQIMEELGQRKTLAGLDVTELCPIPYLHAPDYLSAKLIYLTLGYFLSKKEGL